MAEGGWGGGHVNGLSLPSPTTCLRFSDFLFILSNSNAWFMQSCSASQCTKVTVELPITSNGQTSLCLFHFPYAS